MRNLQVLESPGKQGMCSFSFISVTSTQPILRLGYQVPQQTLFTLFIELFSKSAKLLWCVPVVQSHFLSLHTYKSLFEIIMFDFVKKLAYTHVAKRGKMLINMP